MDSFYAKGAANQQALPTDDGPLTTSNTSCPVTHGTPQIIGVSERSQAEGDTAIDEIEESRTGWFAYFTTRNFWIVLVLGQILALCITSTNTFTTLLVNEGTSIPAFQTFFNYVLLNLGYTSYTLYRYGFKKWCRLIYKDGWKYFILSFFDVEGNYFFVLAYRYVAGILICIGGFGILLASDHITGATNLGPISRGNQIKGDLFALLGATFYGMSNVAEEFLVSKRPLYEVVGQLGFWGMLINGTQAGIFDRTPFRKATWNGKLTDWKLLGRGYRG
ncbi:MAG: hypothetical protein Q9195_007446 [Heterodermia aff. obscurata]